MNVNKLIHINYVNTEYVDKTRIKVTSKVKLNTRSQSGCGEASGPFLGFPTPSPDECNSKETKEKFAAYLQIREIADSFNNPVQQDSRSEENHNINNCQCPADGSINRIINYL